MNTLTVLNAALDGRYAIEREIGRGGMATVYLAGDLRHQRRVAVKVLNAELGALLGVERFLSEIRVTANLQHPNLLALFDSGEADGLLYYVMPYIEGESLRERLAREKQLPVDEAVRLAVAVANALSYAHSHGVIHRDLKPENILLQAGHPLVADFGIALAVSNAGGSRITQTGLSLGTPQYMSPEQAAGDRLIDGRTDIYSLAAVTYEMLTGEPPHVGNTAQAVIAKLMTEDVRPITLFRPSVSTHVDTAVRHALQRVPADRFATAAEFAEALQSQALPPYAGLAEGPSRVAVVRTGARRFAREITIAILALVLGAAVMLGPRAGVGPLTITQLAPPPGQELSELESFGALSPDGRRFAFGDGRVAIFGYLPRRLLAIDLESGTTRELLPQGHDPQLIGSNLLLYGLPASSAGDSTVVYAQRFDSRSLKLEGTRVALTEGVRTSAGVFSYTAAANALVYLPGIGDHGEIRTNRTGHVVDTVRSDGAWTHTWARDHPWVAHSSGERVSVFDLDRNLETPVRTVGIAGLTGTSEGDYFVSPVWSPHDSLLAFAAYMGPPIVQAVMRIAARRIADGREVVLATLDSGVSIWPTTWSADGRYVLGTRFAQTFTMDHAEIWAVDLTTRKASPLLAPSYPVLEPALSRDDQSVAYVSLESGVPEIVLQPFHRPGTAQRVSTGGGRSPRWRRDGRELIYQAPDGAIMAVDITPGVTPSIGTPHLLFMAPAWTRHLFFDVATSFGMSADAQQFTLWRTATGTTAVLLQNWQSKLR